MSYSSEVLADSPAAYFRHGEASGTTLVDSSGNARNGTYSGGTLGQTSLIAASSDTAWMAPSTGSGMAQVAYGSWLNSASITVEAWTVTTTTANRVLMCRDIQTGTRVWQLAIAITTGKLTFAVLGGSNPVATSVAAVNDGKTHHIVVTYDGTTCKFYIDGALDSSSTLSQALAQPTATPLTIGNTNRTITAPWGQVIDESAFYPAVLSPTRIAAHYSAGIINGPFATTLADTTLAASGSVTAAIAGTLAATLDSTTLTASGSETISGALATTLGNTTLVASGTETATGTLATTLANTTLAASGSVAASVTGTLATTLDDATLVGSGVETVTGTLATTLDSTTLTASGSVALPVTGALAAALASTTLAATGTSLIVLPTPTSRTYVIRREPRTSSILAETRRTTILAEYRTLSIPAEPRTRTIPAEPRTLEVTT